MNYLSVCSGIEAASVAWHPLNFRPIGFSEIETFPCSVLSHHFPDVPNFGDMNNFEEWNINGTVDILVGGTPCQSFSVAGLRKGLTDDRGNLALTYCRILQKFRPQWFVWENVPGVLSSNGGRDFGSILGAMVELGYGIAYRVLDAQYFGVPQRRRRVFVVGCFGDWRRAAEVLFEPGCVSGDSKKGGKARKDVAGSLASRTSGGGGLGTDFDLAGGLTCHPIPAHGHPPAIATSTGRLSHCLNAGGMGRQDYETETMVVSFSGRDRGDDGRGYNREPNITGPITETVDSTKPPRVAGPSTGVRRLTPRECERLQGFPDDWTLVPHREKPAADGPRYKAIGNSMAVPVMRWIGQRILQQHQPLTSPAGK